MTRGQVTTRQDRKRRRLYVNGLRGDSFSFARPSDDRRVNGFSLTFSSDQTQQPCHSLLRRPAEHLGPTVLRSVELV